jgi:hypothetical protein
MKKLSTMTRAIQLYSSGVELAPPIAAEFGLKVTAWIDKNTDRNEREIKAAIDLARHNSHSGIGGAGALALTSTADDIAAMPELERRVCFAVTAARPENDMPSYQL